ncbi:pilus assembly protein [Cupriavidus sp. UYMMa02A]|nr:pilus assembly protein [Cupriavidus sp. UYMMa02A]
MQTQLESWAKRVGWKVFWNSPDSWVVPNEKAYGSDFAESAGAAIEDIARNGADLVYDAWTENRVVVIQQGGQ